MKFEEFGDVVKDGKEDDGKNVGPSGPGVRKLKKEISFEKFTTLRMIEGNLLGASGNR